MEERQKKIQKDKKTAALYFGKVGNEWSNANRANLREKELNKT